MPQTDLNEAITRAQLIDPALQRAGWDNDISQQVGKETPVDGSSQAAWSRLRAKLQTVQEGGSSYNVRPAELPSGISDYALYRPNGETIAIVEAKRTSNVWIIFGVGSKWKLISPRWANMSATKARARGWPRVKSRIAGCWSVGISRLAR